MFQILVKYAMNALAGRLPLSLKYFDFGSFFFLSDFPRVQRVKKLFRPSDILTANTLYPPAALETGQTKHT
jgi:hypothetical protein